MIIWNKEMKSMEHNPFISLNDETEITYSDLKNNNGAEYITIYFETPNVNAVSGFNSASCDYPIGAITNIVGYTKQEVEILKKYIDKAGSIALEAAKEEAYCQVL